MGLLVIGQVCTMPKGPEHTITQGGGWPASSKWQGSGIKQWELPLRDNAFLHSFYMYR